MLSIQGRDSGAPAFVFTDDNWELTVATTGPVLTLAPANCSTSAQRTQQPVQPPAAATVAFTCSGAGVSFRVEATYRLRAEWRFLTRELRVCQLGTGHATSVCDADTKFQLVRATVWDGLAPSGVEGLHHS